MLPFELTKDTPHLALSGELWSVFCEYFNRNWPCYKGFLLYMPGGAQWLITGSWLVSVIHSVPVRHQTTAEPKLRYYPVDFYQQIKLYMNENIDTFLWQNIHQNFICIIAAILFRIQWSEGMYTKQPAEKVAGPSLNRKTVFPRHGDSHVKR